VKHNNLVRYYDYCNYLRKESIYNAVRGVSDVARGGVGWAGQLTNRVVAMPRGAGRRRRLLSGWFTVVKSASDITHQLAWRAVAINNETGRLRTVGGRRAARRSPSSQLQPEDVHAAAAAVQVLSRGEELQIATASAYIWF